MSEGTQISDKGGVAREGDRRGRWQLALILGIGLVVCPGEIKCQLEGGVVDVGLLAGRVLSTGSVYLSASGGLAPVFGRRISTTFGVPFEVQAFLRWSFVGIGAYGFGNLNPRESFA